MFPRNQVNCSRAHCSCSGSMFQKLLQHATHSTDAWAGKLYCQLLPFASDPKDVAQGLLARAVVLLGPGPIILAPIGHPGIVRKSGRCGFFACLFWPAGTNVRGQVWRSPVHKHTARAVYLLVLSFLEDPVLDWPADIC